jgi:hypothetical protein
LLAVFFLFAAFRRAARGLYDTYSIANIQLILWTSVIMGSYVAMAALKGDLEQIPANTLTVMGISGTSTSMATIIRSTQEPDVKERKGGAFKSESEPDARAN